MQTLQGIAANLAAHLLAGTWTRRALSARMGRFLGGHARMSRRRLVDHVLTEAPDYPPSPKQLQHILLKSGYLERAAKALLRSDLPVRLVLDAPVFAPAGRYSELDVPSITTSGELAEWFGVAPERLGWLADDRRQHGRTREPVLQNYLYSFLPKKSGGYRLLESPKSDLKALQRRILRDMLDNVPPHAAVHGFVRGRSCLTAAHLHAGEQVVVGMDIRDFFPATRADRVHMLFRRIGYPHAVARLLTGLCTTATPVSAFARSPDPSAFDWEMRRRLASPHLPQGAPTSPALANLVASTLDARLAGLARTFSASYTRYADDLAFSGDQAFEASIDRFVDMIELILMDEGWRVNREKTRIMRRSSAQVVTGIVVNDHLNVRRCDYDELKATLFNCVRRGPASQNRSRIADFRAHLDGRIEWVRATNPARGAKLRGLYDAINWSAPS